MESENKQTEKPKDDKKVNTDTMFYELSKTLNRVVLMTKFLVWYVKYGKRIFDLLTNLMGVAWFALLLVGIWSDGWMHIKVAFTILIGGTILLFLLKAVVDFTKKPAPKKEPAPPMSEEARSMMIMSFIIDKLKNDEGYRKEVSEKFYKDLMGKKAERAEGEREEEKS